MLLLTVCTNSTVFRRLWRHCFNSKSHSSSLQDNPSQAGRRPIYFIDIPTSLYRPNFSQAVFSGSNTLQGDHRSHTKVEFGVSPHVRALVADYEAIAREYFEKVHWWLPIVSRQRFSHSMLDHGAETNRELILLMVAMKAVVWRPIQDSDDPLTDAYVTAKHAIAEATMAGALSLPLLQAQILLAVYELGHALYPVAFLSVGACAQYGIAADIPDSLDPKFHSNNISISPLEVEERRRAWWAVLILDR